ncbi:MAG: FeoA family protein [Myxococcota bacterium]
MSHRRRAPLGGPVELRIGRTCLALRIAEAQKIHVAASDA